MTDPAAPTRSAQDHATPAHGLVDPGRRRGSDPFDRDDQFSGQVYDRDLDGEMGRQLPAGQEDRVKTGGDPTTPPAADNRASFDPKTGAVHDVKLVEDGGLPSA